jgi:hypothetical protein
VAVEKGEHGQAAPVVVGGLRDAQLHENAAHVLLDRALRDPQLVGDAGIRPALGHESQHFSFPRREVLQGVVDTAGGEQFLDESRIDDRGALEDPVERGEEVLHVADPVLEQVAGAPSAREQLRGLLHLDVRGQHQDGRLRQFPTDHPRRLEPLAGPRGWHPDVHDGQVGSAAADQREELGRVTGPTDDVEARTDQKAGQALAQQHVVVGHHDPATLFRHGDEYRGRPRLCPAGRRRPDTSHR